MSYYYNGVLGGTGTIGSTIPYYIGIGKNGYYQMASYWDNIVIGTSEEHNVISCPPQTWFVAKDIFDPGFSGLYSAPDTQVYTNAMHCSYATDDGNAMVVIEHVGTGTQVYTTNITNSYSGILTLNLTSMLFDSGAPFGKYRVWITGSSAEDYFW